RDQDGVVEFTAGVLETRLNVLGLKVGKLLQDLCRSQTVGQEVQNVNHADAHSPDAGASAALLGVYCDAIHVLSVRQKITVCTRELADRPHDPAPPSHRCAICAKMSHLFPAWHTFRVTLSQPIPPHQAA